MNSFRKSFLNKSLFISKAFRPFSTNAATQTPHYDIAISGNTGLESILFVK